MLFASILFADRRQFWGVMVSFSIFISTFVPWIIRNANVPKGGYFLSSGALGVNLWEGTWVQDPHVNPLWLRGKELPAYVFRDEGEKELVEKAYASKDDDTLRRVAVNVIQRDPQRVIMLWLRRSYYGWFGTRTEANQMRFAKDTRWWIVFKSAFFALNAVVILLALPGGVIAIRRSGVIIMPFVLVPIYFYVIYLPFINVEPRYSVAALPCLYLFDLVTLASAAGMWRAFRSGRRGRVTVRDSRTGVNEPLHKPQGNRLKLRVTNERRAESVVIL